MRLLVHHCAICHNARGTARGTNLKRSEQNMVNILKRIWIFGHFEGVPRVVRVTWRVMPSSGCCMGRSSMWGRYSCRFKAIEHLGLWLMWSCGCLYVCVCVFLGIILCQPAGQVKSPFLPLHVELLIRIVAACHYYELR